MFGPVLAGHLITATWSYALIIVVTFVEKCLTTHARTLRALHNRIRVLWWGFAVQWFRRWGSSKCIGVGGETAHSGSKVDYCQKRTTVWREGTVGTSILPCLLWLGNALLVYKPTQNRPHYDMVIFIVRNPFHALVSESNRELSSKHGLHGNTSSSHTDSFGSEYFGTCYSSWTEFTFDRVKPVCKDVYT